MKEDEPRLHGGRITAAAITTSAKSAYPAFSPDRLAPATRRNCTMCHVNGSEQLAAAVGSQQGHRSAGSAEPGGQDHGRLYGLPRNHGRRFARARNTTEQLGESLRRLPRQQMLNSRSIRCTPGSTLEPVVHSKLRRLFECLGRCRSLYRVPAHKRRRPRTALASLLLAAAAFIDLPVALRGAQAEKPAQAPEAETRGGPGCGGRPAEYVGSDVCQGCHEDIFNAFQKNPHALVDTSKKRGWEGKACESCHGPGSKHAESASADDIINPGKQQPAEADRICLKCHLNQPTHIGPHPKQPRQERRELRRLPRHSQDGPQRPGARASPSAVNAQCAACHGPSLGAVPAAVQAPAVRRAPCRARIATTRTAASCRATCQTFAANEAGLLQVPRREARPVHLRARAHAPGRLRAAATSRTARRNPRMLTRQRSPLRLPGVPLQPAGAEAGGAWAWCHPRSTICEARGSATAPSATRKSTALTWIRTS